jgi:hypothetical protein
MADRVLRTERGSRIARSRHGVGKDIGGAIYVHHAYEGKLPNQPQLVAAKKVLKAQHPDFKYNVVKHDIKNNRTSFFHSPDFDTADEPTAGEYVTVEGNRTGRSKTKSIWHHKWTFVDDDYAGFDVDKSFDRSRRWLSIPGINFSHIGNPEIWNRDYVPRIPSR